MSRDRSDAIVTTYAPVVGPRRRVIFEPRDDGWWDRIEQEYTGCAWRPVGVEAVRSVAVETAEATP